MVGPDVVHPIGVRVRVPLENLCPRINASGSHHRVHRRAGGRVLWVVFRQHRWPADCPCERQSRTACRIDLRVSFRERALRVAGHDHRIESGDPGDGRLLSQSLIRRVGVVFHVERIHPISNRGFLWLHSTSTGLRIRLPGLRREKARS